MNVFSTRHNGTLVANRNSRVGKWFCDAGESVYRRSGWLRMRSLVWGSDVEAGECMNVSRVVRHWGRMSYYVSEVEDLSSEFADAGIGWNSPSKMFEDCLERCKV